MHSLSSDKAAACFLQIHFSNLIETFIESILQIATLLVCPIIKYLRHFLYLVCDISVLYSCSAYTN